MVRAPRPKRLAVVGAKEHHILVGRPLLLHRIHQLAPMRVRPEQLIIVAVDRLVAFKSGMSLDRLIGAVMVKIMHPQKDQLLGVLLGQMMQGAVWILSSALS